MISVIVPIYKVEPYLRKCVDSILAQTYRNLEVILVDDGSPDGCPAICDEYATKDSRVKVIHKPNGGLSDARNAGLDIARGEWISFIDSDDWIEPDMYEYLLKKAHESGAEMSIGGVNDELIEGNTTKVVKTTFHGETEEKSISNTDAMEQFLETSWAAWDKLYRRELFDGIRYPVGEINEDEAIVLQLLERCTKVAYTNKVFYHYIRRPESITTSTFTEKKLAWYRHCVDNLEWIKAHHPELEPLAAKRLCGSVIYFADEISCANKKYWHLMNDLLSDLRKKYRSYIRKFPNGIDKLKLYILRYAPYEVYRIIMRTGRWVHAKI